MPMNKEQLSDHYRREIEKSFFAFGIPNDYHILIDAIMHLCIEAYYRGSGDACEQMRTVLNP